MKGLLPHKKMPNLVELWGGIIPCFTRFKPFSTEAITIKFSGQNLSKLIYYYKPSFRWRSYLCYPDNDGRIYPNRKLDI